jgi:hypothetical protein
MTIHWIRGIITTVAFTIAGIVILLLTIVFWFPCGSLTNVTVTMGVWAVTLIRVSGWITLILKTSPIVGLLKTTNLSFVQWP